MNTCPSAKPTARRSFVEAGSGTSCSRARNSSTATTRPALVIGRAQAPLIPGISARRSAETLGSTATLATQTKSFVCRTRPDTPSPFRSEPWSVLARKNVKGSGSERCQSPMGTRRSGSSGETRYAQATGHPDHSQTRSMTRWTPDSNDFTVAATSIVSCNSVCPANCRPSH